MNTEDLYTPDAIRDRAVRWIAGLRSGKYEQKRGRLISDCDGKRSFCCLGVACEIFRDEISGIKISGSLITWGDSNESVYDKFDKILGLSSNMLTHCIEMNDAEKKSFSEIADWLEENLLRRLESSVTQ